MDIVSDDRRWSSSEHLVRHQLNQTIVSKFDSRYLPLKWLRGRCFFRSLPAICTPAIEDDVYLYAGWIHLIPNWERCRVKLCWDVAKEIQKHPNKSVLIRNLLWHNMKSPLGVKQEDKAEWVPIVPRRMKASDKCDQRIDGICNHQLKTMQVSVKIQPWTLSCLHWSALVALKECIDARVDPAITIKSRITWSTV